MDINQAGRKADFLIADEVAIQDRMWGAERADYTDNQLLSAAQAQLLFLSFRLDGEDADEALELAKDICYPKDWDGSAFRDYDSNVANLVVAVAFLRSEIKRRIFAGESTFRAPRSEPYETAKPLMSSAQAAHESRTTFHHPV